MQASMSSARLALRASALSLAVSVAALAFDMPLQKAETASAADFGVHTQSEP